MGDEIKGFGDPRGGKDYYVGPFYLTNTSLVNPLFETTRKRELSDIRLLPDRSKIEKIPP